MVLLLARSLSLLLNEVVGSGLQVDHVICCHFYATNVDPMSSADSCEYTPLLPESNRMIGSTNSNSVGEVIDAVQLLEDMHNRMTVLRPNQLKFNCFGDRCGPLGPGVGFSSDELFRNRLGLVLSWMLE